jgi:uncharacterized membrane protein
MNILKGGILKERFEKGHVEKGAFRKRARKAA